MGHYRINGDHNIYPYGAYANQGLASRNTRVISYDGNSSNWSELDQVNMVLQSTSRCDNKL